MSTARFRSVTTPPAPSWRQIRMIAVVSGVNPSIRSVIGIFSDPITPTNRLASQIGMASARTTAKNANGDLPDGAAAVTAGLSSELVLAFRHPHD